MEPVLTMRGVAVGEDGWGDDAVGWGATNGGVARVLFNTTTVLLH